VIQRQCSQDDQLSLTISSHSPFAVDEEWRFNRRESTRDCAATFFFYVETMPRRRGGAPRIGTKE
jgi:hypothetical protein